jgi:hypothetical protein
LSLKRLTESLVTGSTPTVDCGVGGVAVEEEWGRREETGGEEEDVGEAREVIVGRNKPLL